MDMAQEMCNIHMGNHKIKLDQPPIPLLPVILGELQALSKPLLGERHDASFDTQIYKAVQNMQI